MRQLLAGKITGRLRTRRLARGDIGLGTVGTMRVTAAEREAAIRERRMHFQLRPHGEGVICCPHWRQ